MNITADYISYFIFSVFLSRNKCYLKEVLQSINDHKLMEIDLTDFEIVQVWRKISTGFKYMSQI